MKYIKNACFALLLIAISSCTSQKKEIPQVHMIDPYAHDVITLEHVKTHTIAYCRESENFSVEECALDLEQRGFVRLTDIPKVTADKDFLTTGTYPTRRWRETDVIPRW